MSISEYLISVVATAAIGIIADIVVKSSTKPGGIERYVRLAVSLCVLSCVVLPFSKLELDESIFDRERYTLSGNENIVVNELYIAERESEDRLSEYIFQKYGIKPISVSIDMILREEENLPELESVKIVLKKTAAEKVAEIYKDLSGQLKTEVSVENEE